MNTLVSNLKQVSEESRKTRGAEEKRYFHINTNNVLEHLQKMIEGAKDSIQIMVDQWGLNLLAECKEQILTSLRKNVDIKIIIPSSQVGTDAFHRIPNAKIRMAEIVQNCFIFDHSEILIVDSNNGKGAVFSSPEVLEFNQSNIFNHIWKNSLKINILADLTKNEAQEICNIINIINQNGFGHLLSSEFSSKRGGIDIISLLEKNGINLKSKSLNEIVDLVDSTLQITCSGHVNFDENSKNIIIESKVNSGHSLPWVAILEDYLDKHGYKTRTILQNQLQKGEKVHIKIFPK
jgi:hypothetical protein